MLKIGSLLNFDVWFFTFAGYLIIKGLIGRNNSFLTAESGLGYMLGIVGSTMMLLLLLYPLRKHVKILRNLAPIKYWFRIHMLLGVAGPVLVLYHANFGLGSANSNIALFCMLTVAGSGLFGRLFYRKIHNGLYGQKVELGELKQSLQQLKRQFAHDDIHERIDRFESSVLKHRPLLIALLYMPLVRWHTRRTRKQIFISLRKLVSAGGDKQQALAVKQQMETYFQRITRVADFSVYERLFSLWHVLHIPLFIMMIISGVIHVFAVHIY